MKKVLKSILFLFILLISIIFVPTKNAFALPVSLTGYITITDSSGVSVSTILPDKKYNIKLSIDTSSLPEDIKRMEIIKYASDNGTIYDLNPSIQVINNGDLDEFKSNISKNFTDRIITTSGDSSSSIIISTILYQCADSACFSTVEYGSVDKTVSVDRTAQNQQSVTTGATISIWNPTSGVEQNSLKYGNNYIVRVDNIPSNTSRVEIWTTKPIGSAPISGNIAKTSQIEIVGSDTVISVPIYAKFFNSSGTNTGISIIKTFPVTSSGSNNGSGSASTNITNNTLRLQSCSTGLQGVIQCYVNNTTVFIFWFSSIVSVIMIMIAGLMMMTSAGDSKKITTGKSALTAAIIGLVITFLSFTILTFVNKNFIQSGSSSSGGTSIQDKIDDAVNNARQ